MFPYYKYSNILLEKHNTLCFINHKVASTSLKTWCAKLLKLEINENVHFEIDFPYSKLESIQKLEKYFKFYLVRNPYDRLASCFNTKIKSENFNSPYHLNGVAKSFVKYGCFYGGMSFLEFAKQVTNIDDSIADIHFRSQHYPLLIDDELIKLNQILKLEEIDTNFPLIQERLGFYEPLLAMNTSTGNTELYRKQYDKEIIALVQERYRIDFQTFNYTLEL